MKIAQLLTAFLLFSFFANSQTIDNMKLWPNQAPYSNGKTTPMKEVRPTFFSNIGEAELDIYRPEPGKANGTAVIICPGGGYAGESMIKEGSQVALWFNSFGVTGIVLKYRIPGSDGVTDREKAPISDAQRAIRYIRSKSAELGLKSNQIGIMGFSAGGHLASTAGTHFDDGNTQASDPVEKVSCRPDFMLLIYPVVSMDTTITHRGSRLNLLGKNPDPEKVKYYSADQNVTANTPPTFLVHASDDKTVKVDNSINLYFALQRMGIPVEMHIFEKGGHGFGLDQTKGTALAWPDRCKGWMEQHNFLK
ncbi:MAG: alpha/beta hydrolase [Bacteroidetes bacterium]|nr:alpha/beta hydrolase [Bacteroidota bacterium]